ncbi:hypothetical protein [Pseudomonas mucidolens]|uniref:Lipoprotein n=1 Tax=Pseudomonas mucidolens TaxID=46679 RepID=A0A1H2MSJ3_9PSED|nr:hypothetical protein [Pseudomonas mucidolens]SDU95921.1 hypothetical protein SAMN05216202_2258 [Pseudomonas mucidolens]SQH33348.1 lipoprotein [Pseudomonas mucidolens]
MKVPMRNLAALTFGLMLSAITQAQNAPSNNNPYNGPIHRANPNSMQGTQPTTPILRGGTYTAPVPRPPTLENGGIGNRYPQRDTAPVRPSTQPSPPTRDANGNRQP